MELYCNTACEMTRWLVQRGALTSTFVLVDVGVQGGISPRWHALGDYLTVYGFDLLEEAIAPLAREGDPRRHYFALGLADRDGELEIAVPANRFETMLSSHGPGERRRIQIRRLDTLFSEGLVQPADFIKLDCEGYESIVLKGADAYLAASNLLGADLESSFNISPLLPKTHFSECCDPLVQQRLIVFDIAFNRVPIIDLPALAGRSVHRPGTVNLLLSRNLTQERDSPASYVYRAAERQVSAQTILKSAIVFEAYGLLDWSAYVLKNFADLIGGTIDIDAAIARLAPPSDAAAKDMEIDELRKSLQAIYASHSWRVTAPLRKLKTWIDH